MPDDSGAQVIFQEKQYFRQVWMWLIMGIPFFIVVSLFVMKFILQRPLGEEGASDIGLVIMALVLTVLILLFMFTVYLKTEVRPDGLYVRFFPLHFSDKHIPSENIENYYVRTYKPIREYGGWGIRYGRKGKAYNVSGNRGLQLEFSDGKKLLIGSQCSEELAAALEKVMGRKPENPNL